MNYTGTYGLDKPCLAGRSHRWHRAGHIGPENHRRQLWRCSVCGVGTTLPPPVPTDRLPRKTA